MLFLKRNNFRNAASPPVGKIIKHALVGVFVGWHGHLFRVFVLKVFSNAALATRSGTVVAITQVSSRSSSTQLFKCQLFGPALPIFMVLGDSCETDKRSS